MKILSIILSIYLTCLTLVPCSDYEHENSNSTVEIEAPHDHEHSNGCEDDMCTPFCTCTCCHTNITINSKTKVVYTELLVPNVIQHTVYTDMVTNPYQEPLFHPPIG